MSEIRAATVSNVAGTGPATLTGQSAAKSFSRGSTLAFSFPVAFNVSSTTDVAAGTYQPNLTSSMDSATYAMLASGINNATNADTAHNAGQGSVTAALYTVQHVEGAVIADTTIQSSAVFGDLA